MKTKYTLDDALRPMSMECGKCGATMTVYPDEQTGRGYCPNCSPKWLQSFAIFSMNQLRAKHGLKAV